MNRDPLKEDGGINLYGMVGNNPINDVDEYGLATYTDKPYSGGGSGGGVSTSVNNVPMTGGGGSSRNIGINWDFWRAWVRVQRVTRAGPKSDVLKPVRVKNPSVRNPPAGRSGTVSPRQKNITVRSSRKRAKDSRPKPKPPQPDGKRITSQTKKGKGAASYKKVGKTAQDGNKSYTDGMTQKKHLHDREHLSKKDVVPHYTFPKGQ